MAKKKATPTKKAAGKAKAPARKPARTAGKSAPTKKAATKKKATARPAKKAAPKKPARPAGSVAGKKKAPLKKAPAKKGAAPKKPAPPAKKAAAPPKAQAKAATPTRPAAKAPAPTKAAAPAKPETPKRPAPAATKEVPAKASTARPPKPKEPIIAVMTGLEPLGGPSRPLKRALKERFQQEFYLRATPGSLYDLISSPSGFSEWFCDDVDVSGDEYTFKWGQETQQAECLSRKFGELIRFRWLDDDDPGAFFELRIRIDPMTNETCLVVTDHAWPQDLEEAKALWESQIHTLARVLGA